MYGESVRELVVDKLRYVEFLDQAGLQIRVEQAAINARGLPRDREIAKHIFAYELWNPSSAVHEPASDRNAIAVIVLQSALGADDRIDQSGGAARAVISRSRADCAIRAIEQESAFLHCPAIIAADRDAVNFLDVVLT